MELLLHIGHEKTGTTSIQNFLVENSPVLRQKSICVPSEFGVGSMVQITAMFCNDIVDHLDLHGVSDSEAREKQVLLKENFGNFLSAQSDKEKIILSSEHLASRLTTFNEISEFKKYLDRYFQKITVLFYVRNQADLARSAYSTQLVGGSPGEIYFEPIDSIKDSAYFNYKILLKPWIDVFSVESIRIVSYDAEVKKKRSIVESFIEIVESVFRTKFDNIWIGKNALLNKSLSRDSLTILRKVNVGLIEENSQVAIKPHL